MTCVGLGDVLFTDLFRASFITITDQAAVYFTSLREIVARTRPGDAADPFAPHRLSFCSLLYVESGSGTHQLDGRSYELSAGDAAGAVANYVGAEYM